MCEQAKKSYFTEIQWNSPERQADLVLKEMVFGDGFIHMEF